MKFGLGQPVRRFEDQTLITGKGRYTDDIKLEKMAEAFVLRSQVAHAKIRKIDVAAARKMPGVLLVLTGDDVEADGLETFHATRRSTTATARRGMTRRAQRSRSVRCAMSANRSRWSSPRRWRRRGTPPMRSRSIMSSYRV